MVVIERKIDWYEVSIGGLGCLAFGLYLLLGPPSTLTELLHPVRVTLLGSVLIISALGIVLGQWTTWANHPKFGQPIELGACVVQLGLTLSYGLLVLFSVHFNSTVIFFLVIALSATGRSIDLGRGIARAGREVGA